jgi:hypothetical protein
MLYAKTAIEYRGTAAALLPPIGAVGTIIEEPREDRRLAAEQAVDQMLADSFPASDPASWTPGIVQTNPVAIGFEPEIARDGGRTAGAADSKTDAGHVVHTSAPIATQRSFGQRVVSFVAAIGAVLLLPLAILLIGLPVAAAVRGLLELIGWAVGAALL